MAIVWPHYKEPVTWLSIAERGEWFAALRIQKFSLQKVCACRDVRQKSGIWILLPSLGIVLLFESSLAGLTAASLLAIPHFLVRN